MRVGGKKNDLTEMLLVQRRQTWRISHGGHETEISPSAEEVKTRSRAKTPALCGMVRDLD